MQRVLKSHGALKNNADATAVAHGPSWWNVAEGKGL